MLNEQEKSEHRQLSKECLKGDAVRENVDPRKLARLKQLTEKAKLPPEEKGSAPETTDPIKSTATLQNQSGDSTKSPEKTVLILSKIKLDDISKLPLEKLRAICKQEYLPTEADQDVLVKIVRAKKLGGDIQVINNNTLCKYCKYPARVISSEIKTVFQDKSRIVWYRLKCTGPRPHTFSQKQRENAVQKDKTQKKTAVLE